MALPGSSLNILPVYARELIFSFENSASSKPPPTIGHHFYGPSGDAFELWAKMVVLRIKPSASCMRDLLTMKEYHCLLQLLCPDFPLELTQKAARIVLMDDAMDCLMSFSDFLFAFQIQFYYSEFLDSVAAIYQDLLSGKNPNTVIVPTSFSGQHRQRPALGEAGMLEGVEASLFYQCLENLCDRHKYSPKVRMKRWHSICILPSSCPPPALVKEVLSNVQRLTFYGFLVALSKHHGINQALGALPDKGDLMHDPAMDEELERLVVRSRLQRTARQHRGKRQAGGPRESILGFSNDAQPVSVGAQRVSKGLHWAGRQDGGHSFTLTHRAPWGLYFDTTLFQYKQS
ncbi:centriolar satellite-associated tubulin polyglutamylase complex regulator 1 isoform X5 [Ictidomys tridecemlineatus]|uniref:UPF0705 protein C11orf49 homolog isoform X4 n=1 Tax=Ictidomys tridecemlineatus TaxID=43179 RepID=UPI001A9D5099|nr:UPF0705 protein C11orf49 homolog isoform X4 [Ictidomys tridecemlineatus]XP_040140345.1 UPF0705 protein C11orf49 homolog isoform X4 [Ictidomys tridecemlineatus]